MFLDFFVLDMFTMSVLCVEADKTSDERPCCGVGVWFLSVLGLKVLHKTGARKTRPPAGIPFCGLTPAHMLSGVLNKTKVNTGLVLWQGQLVADPCMPVEPARLQAAAGDNRVERDNFEREVLGPTPPTTQTSKFAGLQQEVPSAQMPVAGHSESEETCLGRTETSPALL
ncbi:unnamed protein product [Symbiodinium sp. CCMP2456]|nr:unnamed protein product [Symbiodinium sp. CCMP2456]